MSEATDLPGGFLPQQELPSPSPSISSFSAANDLPHPRHTSLPPGSSKEDLVRRYVEERLLHVSRRYVKKFSKPDPTICLTGFRNFAGLQVPFLLKLASDFTQYVRSFPPAPRASIVLLGKLDHCFASLLSGKDIYSGNSLPGFQNGVKAGMSITDMVRCRSLVEQTRALMIEILSPEADGEADEGTDADADTQSSVDDFDRRGNDHAAAQYTEENKLYLDAARIYEHTIVHLGKRLGDPLVDENVPTNDVVCD